MSDDPPIHDPKNDQDEMRELDLEFKISERETIMLNHAMSYFKDTGWQGDRYQSSELQQLKLKIQTAIIYARMKSRARDVGEFMKESDMVLIDSQLHSLGFHTDYERYYVGLKVTPLMKGKVIPR